MAYRHPLLKPFYGGLRGRFPCFAPISYHSPQKSSNIRAIYHIYLKGVFRALRAELEVEVPKAEHRLPEVPTEEELRQFYQIVWQTRNFADMILIKTLFYTGVRVSELVNIRLTDVDVER